MGEVLHTACPVCHGNLLRTTELKSYQLAICKSCGLIFSNPRPAAPLHEDAADFYLASEPDVDEEVRKQQGRVAWIEQFMPQRGILLDIGCGPGYFVRCAQEAGWQAYGCETSTRLADFAREKLGINVFHCNYVDFPRLSGVEKVQILAAFHVIEHLPRPREFAQFAANVMETGGGVVIEVPNILSFDSLCHKEEWRGLALPSHLFFYTPRSVTRLLESTFDILKIEFSISQFYYEHIDSYLRRLVSDPQDINHIARRFPGDIFMVYARRK